VSEKRYINVTNYYYYYFSIEAFFFFATVQIQLDAACATVVQRWLFLNTDIFSQFIIDSVYVEVYVLHEYFGGALLYLTDEPQAGSNCNA